jgi:hypothetical protein
MNVTPILPHVPFPPAATTLSRVYTPLAYILVPAGVPVVSVPAHLEQPQGPKWFNFLYHLPRCTRVGDMIDVYLDSLGANPVSMLILTFELEPRDLFMVLQNQQGIFKREEMDSDLRAKGVTPGMWNLRVVQSSVPVPPSPAPAPATPRTPLRVVAVSAPRTYAVL